MVQKWGALSLVGSGKSFLEVARRPTCRETTRSRSSVTAPRSRWSRLARHIRQRAVSHLLRPRKTKVNRHHWRDGELGRRQLREGGNGRLFSPSEVDHRRQVVVLGNAPWESLFPNIDPIGKVVRIGGNEFTVIGVLGKRPSPGGFSTGADDFAVIPFSAHEKFYGKVLKGSAMFSASSFNPAVFRTAMIAIVPRDGMRDAAMREVEALMRIRHKLNLEQPNDFDLVTQDAILKVWDQISQATFLGLVVISSIALMVGGIGVMAIMMISVTERTREIGVRKALGARRREILWQFLIEAAFLTSAGGLSGSSSAAASASSSTGSRDSRSRCPGGHSRSVSVSPRPSGSSSASSRQSRRLGRTRLKRCGTSRSVSFTAPGSGAPAS